MLIPGLLEAHAHIAAKDNFEKLIYDHLQIYVGAFCVSRARKLIKLRSTGEPRKGALRRMQERARSISSSWQVFAGYFGSC